MFAPLHNQTPLLLHRQLSQRLSKQVWLKMENAQASGSFKLRGIGLLCQRAVAAGATHLICPSGGNAGFAAAVAGVALNVPTTIVVPASTPLSVRDAIAAIGAAVVVHGTDWDQANEAALAMCVSPGTTIIPPFDHPDIWDGNASLIDEAVAQAPHGFDAVVCSVGGGGLLCGVLEGLHRNGLAQVPVIAVETDGAASLHASIEAGELLTLPAITSIATTLGARRVAAAAFAWRQRHPLHSIVVSDAQAVAACLRFADDARTLVEPACGAALAPLYFDHPVLRDVARPLVVVCGGIGVELAKLSAWQSQFGL